MHIGCLFSEIDYNKKNTLNRMDIFDLNLLQLW